MAGLTVDSWELFESIPENNILQNIDLQVDAEIFNNSLFMRKLRKISCNSLSVRNPVSARLNRLILESGFKLQAEYLDSLARQTEIYGIAGVRKVFFDFDIAGVLRDAGLCSNLRKILASVKGIMYEHDIETELLLRLPAADMEETVWLAADFRQKSMSGMNYAVDMHIHESGFDREEICTMLLPVEFDTGTINFLYDAALGNKINPQTISKIMDHIEGKGAKCDFFLCPSGNINFQSVQIDMELFIKTDKER